MVANTRNSAGNHDGPTVVTMLGIRKKDMDPTKIGIRVSGLGLTAVGLPVPGRPAFHHIRTTRAPINSIGTVIAARSYFITRGFNSAVPTNAMGTHASRDRFHFRTRPASTRSTIPITTAQMTNRTVVGVAVGLPRLHRYKPKTLTGPNPKSCSQSNTSSRLFRYSRNRPGHIRACTAKIDTPATAVIPERIHCRASIRTGKARNARNGVLNIDAIRTAM